ncbi:MAG: GDP-L-fucose synthase, partial [Betaproteobacteria bacterium]|nr:GDP-L-fucose synthase [Betaproteobacteria bacterium]
MKTDAKIYVAGHRGLAGSAIARALKAAGFRNIVTRSHGELELTDAGAVGRFFAQEKPEHVFLAAAKVGGIHANDTYRGDFIRENLAIQTNVIEAARQSGVKRLLFLGSSCVYPREAPQPIREEYLLTGPLEETNRAYAIAKIAGIEMCRAYNRQYGTRFLAAMPTNLYGPGDNYDLMNSHVLPALIRKAHEANASGAGSMAVWGSGRPRREFLYSDDLGQACVFLMKLDDATFDRLLADAAVPALINVGWGEDQTITELAQAVCETVGFAGKLVFDASKPDGMFRKVLDVSRLRALGWQPRVPLREGLRRAYEDFKAR